MLSINTIAIFDIGKTNKKFFLLNEGYKIVLERSVQFEEITDEDGDACEDVDSLSSWVLETMKEILKLKKFSVKAVNFSTYGASFVYIDKDGKVIAPLYNYLKPYPEELKNNFYKKYGSEEKLSLETSSPVLGNLNSGMQLYRLKNIRPDIFSQVKYALHLPHISATCLQENLCRISPVSVVIHSCGILMKMAIITGLRRKVLIRFLPRFFPLLK